MDDHFNNQYPAGYHWRYHRKQNGNKYFVYRGVEYITALSTQEKAEARVAELKREERLWNLFLYPGRANNVVYLPEVRASAKVNGWGYA